MRFLKQLSERDRRALIALAFFLAAVGYALYLLEPLYVSWQASGAEVRDKRRERDRVRRQVRERDSWLADRARLERRVGELGSSLAGPAADLGAEAGTPELVGAILDAAGISGVRVERITPEAAAGGDAGAAGAAAVFSVDASGSIDALGELLGNLWGMRVVDLSVSRPTDGSTLRFFLRVAPLAGQDTAGFRDLAADYPAVPALALLNDPFTARLPRPPPLPAVTETVPVQVVEPEPMLDLSGLYLAGIVQLGDEYMAALVDQYEDANLFVTVGDEARGYAVEAISDSEITFAFEGLTGSLFLPPLRDPEAQLGAAAGSGSGDYSQLVTWEDERAPGGEDPPAVDPDLLARAGARIGAHLVAIAAADAELSHPASRTALFVAEVTSTATTVAPGDLIAGVNGVTVNRLEDALWALIDAIPGQQLTLEILRGGTAGPVVVTAEEGLP